MVVNRALENKFEWNLKQSFHAMKWIWKYRPFCLSIGVSINHILILQVTVQNLVIIVSTDVLASNGIRPSAGTVLTTKQSATCFFFPNFYSYQSIRITVGDRMTSLVMADEISEIVRSRHPLQMTSSVPNPGHFECWNPDVIRYESIA